jgi:hypothetical protein
MSITTSQLPSKQARRARRGGDRATWIVALCATILSVVAYIVSVKQGTILIYRDAISHLEIARRVTSGSEGFSVAQLGSVWLPFQHMLMLPFVWIDGLYYSGFAGSMVSMAAFVGTVVLIYKTVARLGDNKFAGIIGAAIFALNVDMLYMQTTPMTESLLYCMLAGAVYSLVAWADTDKLKYLVLSGLFSIAAALTRYEAWPIVACFVVSVGIITWWRLDPSDINGSPETRNQRRSRLEAHLIFFGLLGGLGVAAWMTWNWFIFGNPLNFQIGDYAKPSLWVGAGEPSVGHLGVAAKTYWFAITSITPWELLVISLIGAIFMIKNHLSKYMIGRILPVASLLVMVPFFVYSLYTGQRPLHVMQVSGDLYNVRFGLIMLLPVSIIIGYLISLVGRMKKPSGYIFSFFAGAIVIVILVLAGISTLSSTPVTVTEARAAQNNISTMDQTAVVNFLKGNYRGGKVLSESFGNELIAFNSVPSAVQIYEGSFRLWGPALHDPLGNNIKWIIMRGGTGPDKVYQTFEGRVPAGYVRAFTTTNGTYNVYRSK